MPQTGWLVNDRHVLLTVRRLEVQGQDAVRLVSGENPLPGSQVADFSLWPCVLEGARSLSGVSL